MNHEAQPTPDISNGISDITNYRRISYTRKSPKEAYPEESCIILIEKIMHIPGSVFAHFFGRSFWLRISSDNRQFCLLKSFVRKPFNNLHFGAYADLSGLEPSALIDFEIYSWDVVSSWYRIGMSSIMLSDLVHRPHRTLLLHLGNGDFMIKKSLNTPTQLHIFNTHIPQSWPQPIESPYQDTSLYDKHVMILTRGTRGDVQPFLALAIGLAEQLNWMVTICTELSYKEFIKSRSRNLSRGAIRFRPSGGDTTARVSNSFLKRALHSTSPVIQSMILARSEAEFFSSEPIMFWWADMLKPSAIIYGFTMASIAMIISEKLEIPMLGFILQPTVIPSSQYPPLESLSQKTIPLLIEDSILSHGFIGALKSYVDYPALTALRRRRGLAATSQPWQYLFEQSSPIIIPINETAFGGRPGDWPKSVEMTDFIYLMKHEQELDPSLTKFLEKAKQDGYPVVVIGFSSMPILREAITKIIMKITQQCELKPRVVALLGDAITEVLSPKSKRGLEQLISSGAVFETRGAPYCKLFAQADCVVIQAGLGATSEAMRAAVPVICTGILLMDQRFWGNRCKTIGIGPEMSHISAFISSCTQQIDDVLAPNSSFALAATKFSPQIRSSVDPTGVTVNIETVSRLLSAASPISTTLRCGSRHEDAVAG